MKRYSHNISSAAVPIKNGNAVIKRAGDTVTVRLTYSAAFGMGEKYDCLNHKGKRVVNTVEEKFCFQGEKTYCPAPFFWTDSGFGFYADTTADTVFDFREDSIEITIPADCDVVTFSGSPQEIIAEYMSLFGKPVLPPEWAFGVWASANRWNKQSDIDELLENLKKHRFPASVIVIEAWSDEATFYIWNGAKYTLKADGGFFSFDDFDFSDSPWHDPKEMAERIHESGSHLVLWQIPVYKKQGADEHLNAQNELDRADAVKRGLCVHNSDGTPYEIPEGHWFSGSMIPDFLDPETEKTWFNKRRYLLDMGVDGFKTDGGEFIYSDDLRFYDGSDGSKGKNRYPMDYTKSYHRFIGENRVLFSRAGFAGAHTVPIHWGGDQQSQNCELRCVLTAGLSASLSGMIFWGFDIGGFAGPLPTLDLYRRATQLACFCPIMQWHSEPDGGQFKELMPGGEGNNERSPWNMAAAYACPEFMDEMRYWHELHEKLRPYLWETAQDCARNMRPMMRALAYDFTDDEIALTCEDEFMLGDALLVAPLLEENALSRRVYLPEGNWADFFTGEKYNGGKTVISEKNGRIPVFIREGFVFTI